METGNTHSSQQILNIPETPAQIGEQTTETPGTCNSQLRGHLDPPQAAAATAANFAARCPPRRRLGKVPRLRAGGVGGLSRGLRGGGWGAGGGRLCGSWGLSQEGGPAVRGLHSQLRPRTAVPAAGERGFAFAGATAGPGPLRPGAHALGRES